MNKALQTGCALLFAVASARNLDAQLVSIRTAPVSVPQQFYTFPSEFLGMGGSLALNDLEADPFSNPATAGRIRGGIVTAAPSLYHVSDSRGFGRTMPVTVMGGGNEAFGALSLAAQELETTPAGSGWWQSSTSTVETHRFAHNKYVFGLLGQRFEKSQSAVALSFSYADLNRVHMVDLLYPQARAINQGGYISDFRAGYTRELKTAATIEATVVANHVDMEHTVTYIDNIWSSSLQRFVTSLPRQEYNADQTTTLGGQVAYKSAIPINGWRLAAAVTANTKTHPKIPNYNFMRIPRDPGNSWAFSFDGGAAWMDTTSAVTFDFSYQPIWTSTWAEAATATKTASGGFIPIGAPTIENEFVFSNYLFHAGWYKRWDSSAVQAGVIANHIGYALDQYDHVSERTRQSDEGWTEWTLTWGFTTKVGRTQLRYFGTHQGNGLGLSWGEQRAPEVTVNVPTTSGPDVVAAPSSPLSSAMAMDVTPVTLHQFMISIPFGKR